MYFPYLRGKQYELVLLEDCRELIKNNGRIIPIIEPVKISTLRNLTKKLINYVENDIPIILIVNPTVGELQNYQNRIFDQVALILNEKGNAHILGYVITEKTTTEDIQQFLQKAKNNKICFIHKHEFSEPSILKNISNLTFQIFIHSVVGITYQRSFSENQRVIIKDGFTYYERNALYPNDENFLDINLTYKEDHYIGFGDFLIVGKTYRDNGGPAHAVAIHITYKKTSGEIGIRHFISDRTTSNVDTPGKFAEALAKLVREKNKTGTLILNTHAMDEFQALHDDGHFPTLGVVKKLSMEHHIELISTII